MKKCKIIKKYWWVLLLVIVIVVGIPIGLNFLLGMEVKCKVIGDASDWLGFWVAYVATMVSTVMVILTYHSLQQNRMNLRQQEIRYNDQANKHILELSLARAQKSYEDICENGKKLNQFGLYQKIVEIINDFQNNNVSVDDIQKRLSKIMQDFTAFYQDFDSVARLYNMVKEDDKSKVYYDRTYKHLYILQMLMEAKVNIPKDIEKINKDLQKLDIEDYVNLFIDVDKVKDEIRASGKNGYKIDTIKQIIDKYIIMSRVQILRNEDDFTGCVNVVIRNSQEALKKCREDLGLRF